MEILKNFIKNECFWFTVILVLGAFLRLYQLEAIPPGFTGDEAWLGLDGQEVLKRGWIGVYIPEHAWGYNAFHAYIAALFMRLFDANVFAVRLATAVPGIFGLAAFYFLARYYFPVSLSLITFAFLAISQWYFHFSRIAFPGIILIPVFSTFSFLFFVNSLMSRQYKHFILTGIFLGLGINSYHYFNFTFLAFLSFLFLKILQKRDFLRIYIKRICVMFIAFFIVVAPYLFYISQHPDILSSKWQHVNIFEQQDISSENNSKDGFSLLIEQVKRTIGVFFILSNQDALNGPLNIHVLEPTLGLIFLLGFLVLLAKIREDKNQLILLWFTSAIVVGVVTKDTPNTKRIIDAIVPTFLIIGYAFLFLQKRLPKRIFSLCIIGLFAYSIVYNIQTYFKQYANDPYIKSRFAYEIVTMCTHLNKLTYPPYIYFYHPSTYFNYETRRFLCPFLAGEDRSREYGLFSLEKETNLPASFVYTEFYQTIVPDLIKKYPNGKIEEFRDDSGNEFLGIFTVD